MGTKVVIVFKDSAQYLEDAKCSLGVKRDSLEIVPSSSVGEFREAEA